MKLNKFKIRASQAYKLMTEPRTKKDKEAGNLSETAKQYIDEWIKQQVYGKQKEILSMAIDKGNIQEDSAIEFLYKNRKLLGLKTDVEFKKNEKEFENEFATGTPDILYKVGNKKAIIDIKNSFDCFSFPLLQDELKEPAYYWQAQVYMMLTGARIYHVAYVLMDIPEEMIQTMYRRATSYTFIDYDEYRQKYIYSDIDPKYRIKLFKVEYNKEDVEKLKKKVEKAREFIKEITSQL